MFKKGFEEEVSAYSCKRFHIANLQQPALQQLAFASYNDIGNRHDVAGDFLVFDTSVRIVRRPPKQTAWQTG